MPFIGRPHWGQNVGVTLTWNSPTDLVTGVLPLSVYPRAAGIDPVRIGVLRHNRQSFDGMWELQPVPEIPLSYAEFLHLGPAPDVEPATTALTPTGLDATIGSAL